MYYLTRGALVAAIILSLISCAGTCEVDLADPVPLPLPMTRKLPRASEADLACLSDPVYEALMQRDLMRKAYADECVSIILSTH